MLITCLKSAQRAIAVIVCLLFAVPIVQVTRPFHALAAPESVSACDLNDIKLDIPYYKTCAQQTTCATSGSVVLVGSENAQKAFNYFVSQGLAPFQSAGIVGNMQAESGVLPERLQNTPPTVQTPADQAESSKLGWGIVQWTPAGKMITPTKAAGKDPNDLGVQLDFLWQSLSAGGNEQGAGDALKAATDVDAAADAFLLKFERPADPSATKQFREQAAEQMLKQYGNGAPASSGTGSSGCAANNGGGAGNYKNPFHDMTNVVQSRIDEGVDYVAKAGTSVPIYAIGNGVVTIATDKSTFYTTSRGNADWITYQLTDGPAKNNYVYVSEGCDHISVKPNDNVTSETHLCDMEPDSIEMGWANSNNQTPAASSVYSEGYQTAYGVNFNQLMVKLGAPTGHCDTGNDPGCKILGNLPAGWPSW